MKINKKVLAVAGVAAVALVGGTFAYFNQSLSIDNPLDTGHYQNVLVEDFTPPADEMKPGQKWDKIVSVQNTGDYPVLVRVRMKEQWVKKSDATGTPFVEIDTTKQDGDSKYIDYAKFTDTTKDEDDIILSKYEEPDADGKGGSFTAYQLEDSNEKDEKGEVIPGDENGLTAGDDSVVYKVLNTVETPGDAGWSYGGDGYWYWNGVLDPAKDEDPDKDKDKHETEPLLKELVLANNIDLGQYKDTEYYVVTKEKSQPAFERNEQGELQNGWKKKTDEWTDEKGLLDWVAETDSDGNHTNVPDDQKMYRVSESKIVEDKTGYADSIYTLTVTSDLVQANEAAVRAIWGDAVANKIGVAGDILSNVAVEDENTDNLKNKE